MSFVEMSDNRRFNFRFRMMFGVVAFEVAARTVARINDRFFGRVSDDELERCRGVLGRIDDVMRKMAVEGDEYCLRAEAVLESVEDADFDSVSRVLDGYFRLDSFRELVGIADSVSSFGEDGLDAMLTTAIESSRIGKAMLRECWNEIMRSFGVQEQSDGINRSSSSDSAVKRPHGGAFRHHRFRKVRR